MIILWQDTVVLYYGWISIIGNPKASPPIRVRTSSLGHLSIVQDLPSTFYLFVWLADYYTERDLSNTHSRVAAADSLINKTKILRQETVVSHYGWISDIFLAFHFSY